MSFLQKSFNEELTENVDEVILGILNPEDIQNGSVCEVLTSETYENSIPKTNGLFDLRMGTIEQGLNCETCFQDQRGCVGHFGHIKLVRPLYHMQFLTILLKIARCFCYSCSECLLEENDKEELKYKPMKARFNIAYKKCKENQNPVCNKCYTIQPIKYVNPKGTQDTKIIAKVYGEFVETIDGEKRKELKYFSCEQMLDFLKRIRNEDLDNIGIPSKTSRPDWMICSVFPVPPPHVRPSVRQENNQKSEDDLTHKLAEIINHNQTLHKEMEKDNLQHIEDWTQLLQYHVATFVDNEIPGIPKAMQRSGRPIKSLKQRLSAKDGRMRYNLMGKRGDFTGRTVITPDPNIELDEIGIPLKIARNLTIPIQVTDNNINILRHYYDNGTDKYPGAKRLERGNKNYSLDGKKFKEQIGDIRVKDILHRNLINGDYVLFNRQPSLHKMSMMGHRVKVLPVGNTFRMNVSATSPYNADFDGDEMNIFLSQCMEGFCELKLLASVPNQIISPQKNAPVIGLVQDTLYVCPQITNENVIIPKDIWMNLSLFLNKEQLTLPQQLTGRKIFETIIPKINIEKDTNLSEVTGNINDKLKIENGIITRGSLDKKVVGSSHGGIIHVLWKDKGPSESKKFIYNCQKLCNQWLLNQGHSIGVSDVILIKPSNLNRNEYIIDNEIYNQITQILDNAIYEVDFLLEKAGQGFYETRSTLSVEDDIETEILFIVNKARDNVGKIAMKHSLEFNEGNRLLKMVLSGSKGDKSGVYQIMATMGEAQVGADRTPKKFYRRVLPHYVKDDNSALSRGFCKSSFKEGMKPLELYQLAIAARIGLIDKTVKTADTGYTQRRLIKSMEDLQVQYDLSVRSANNSILQFMYGDDGFDATYLENVGFKYHLMKDNEFDANSVNLMNCLETLRKTMKKNDSIVVPFNLDRLFVELSNGDIELEPLMNNLPLNVGNIIELRNELLRQIEEYNRIDEKMKDLVSDPFFIVKCYIHFYWRDSEIKKKLEKYPNLKYQHYETYFKKIFDMFIHSLCAAGEMVGVLSGQSIGEPTTQMSLHQNEKLKILIYNKKNNIYSISSAKISDFCDKLILQYPNLTFNTGHYDSVETNINNNDIEYYIMSVDKYEKTNWNKISHISRHPVNGNLVTIKTRSGRNVTTTLSHSHLIRKDNIVQPIRGDELTLGMRIPVSKKLINPVNTTINFIKIGEVDYKLDFMLGWFFGSYLAEGFINGNSIEISNISDHYINNVKKIAELFNTTARVIEKNGEYGLSITTKFNNKELSQYILENCNVGSFNKKLPDIAFLSNNEFKAGILQGYIDGDGNFLCDTNHNQIRCCSRSKQLIKDISLLLNYFDIFGHISEYNVHNKTLYNLCISSKYCYNYLINIGSVLHKDKLTRLNEYNMRNNIFSLREDIDKINGLGQIISDCGSKLNLKGNSRIYKRWIKKESIGRRTLEKYYNIFNSHPNKIIIENELSIIQQALYSDIVWDEIIDINIYTPNQNEYVYDFTIPINQTFMTDYGIYVHNTLNTFHHTGQGGKSPTTSGVPRIKELLGVVKEPKTPVMSLYIHYKNNNGDIISLPEGYKDYEYEYIRKFSFLFNEIYLKDLCDKVSIELKENNWQLVIDFDILTLLKENIDSELIIIKILENGFENFAEGSTIIPNYITIGKKNIFQLIIAINNELLSDIKRMNGIYLKIKSIENELLNILVNGVVNVKNTYISTLDKEMFVQTNGSNLDDVLSRKWQLQIYDDIYIELDKSRCRSNNIHEMYNCFGIEVARETLIYEFSEVLESTGSINMRHITVLVDNMTSKGMLIPIDRHGVKKNDIGPLSRATFEETVDQLMKAAAFGEEDTMRGVSANIMMGQLAPCGTGVSEVMLDETQIFKFNMRKSIDEIETEEEEFIPENKLTDCFRKLNTYNYPFGDNKMRTPIELPLNNENYLRNIETKFNN